MSLDPARIAAIRARAEHATKGPWGWHWEDASLQYLAGPNELEDHVLAVSPCESCQARAEELAKAGRGAGCTTGSPNDHEFIAQAREDIPYLLGIDQKWKGPYAPPTKEARVQTMRARIESVNAPAAYDFQPVEGVLF